SYITLEGGYSPDFKDRNFNNYESTISGEEMGAVTIDKNMVTINGFTISGTYSENGGGIAIDNACQVVITNNTIKLNSANNGGGISITNNSSFVTISRNTISNNNASSGGGIYLDSSSSVVIENNFITDNWSTNFGGGIYIIDSSSNITNNTISNNSSGDCADGSGVYVESGTIDIKNSIIWGNCEGTYTDLYVETLSAVTVTYSDIGTRNIEIDDTNISEYPQFEYVNNFNTYHITKDSPCIDKGTSDGAPKYDIDGEQRPYGEGFDIGADEYYGE
ncbi:MAG: right-handed parallel beta-helix repeat-containing protein, partial [Nitrospinota bacterium]